MPVRTHEFTRPDGILRADADDLVSDAAENLLTHLAGLPAAQLDDDFRVDLGWCRLSVEREEGGWRLRGPDFRGGYADDITPHLVAAIEQARVPALLGIVPQPIRFDAEIAVEHGALEADAIYLRRAEAMAGDASRETADDSRRAPEIADSGWHLGPLTAEAGHDIHLHAYPAHEIAERFPAVVGYLALPTDYLVGVVGGGIDAVFNDQGKRVIGPGGELKIEARPELIERATAELGLSAPEVIVHSRHHPVHGYFMVWRSENDPVMLVLHPNGEQLRLPTLVHPDRVEQHWTDGDRTPPGYVLG